jgi:hypothetical protein
MRKSETCTAGLPLFLPSQTTPMNGKSSSGELPGPEPNRLPPTATRRNQGAAPAARSMTVDIQAAEPGSAPTAELPAPIRIAGAVGTLLVRASGVGGERRSDRECPNGDIGEASYQRCGLLL